MIALGLAPLWSRPAPPCQRRSPRVCSWPAIRLTAFCVTIWASPTICSLPALCPWSCSALGSTDQPGSAPLRKDPQGAQGAMQGQGHRGGKGRGRPCTGWHSCLRTRRHAQERGQRPGQEPDRGCIHPDVTGCAGTGTERPSRRTTADRDPSPTSPPRRSDFRRHRTPLPSH